jgi:hypothetical protein
LPIPTKMADLSITAASNSPAGSEAPISTDDFHRAIQGILRTTNAKGSDIASATTTDIGAATAEFVDVTGTTTITGLGTIAAGIVRTVRFTGALTLTHNGTSLILPSAANITTAANDTAEFRSLGSGNWLCTQYKKQTGAALTASDTAYNATSWNGSLVAPSQNAVRDEMEAVKATRLGVNQTWQSVTGSRALGTPYTNSTGAPIMVHIRLTSNAAASPVLTVDGLTILGTAQNTTGTGAALTIIVPDGGVYTASVTAGAGTVSSWAELRA